MTQRAMWAEKRQESDGYTLLVYLIGDLTANGWEFFEREACELRWYPIATTAELTKKAVAELGRPGVVSKASIRPLKQVA